MTVNEMLAVASRLEWPDNDPRTKVLAKMLQEAIGVKANVDVKKGLYERWVPTKGEDGKIMAPKGFNPEAWRSDEYEGWSKRYEVKCPNFGKLLKRGGCSCGSGNLHECALDKESTRLKCQKCYHNKGVPFARLVLAYNCPECVQVKDALAEAIGADKLKKLLTNKLGNVRVLHYVENENAQNPTYDREANLATVKNIKDELDKQHWPEDAQAPLLLLEDGTLLRRPDEIAKAVIAVVNA